MKLKEIQELCDNTTLGMWRLCFHLQSSENDKSCACGYRGSIWGPDGEHVICEMGPSIIKGEEGLEPKRYDRDQELKNAQFIVASRTLVSKLLVVASAAQIAMTYAHDFVPENIDWCFFNNLNLALQDLEKDEL